MKTGWLAGLVQSLSLKATSLDCCCGENRWCENHIQIVCCIKLGCYKIKTGRKGRRKIDVDPLSKSLVYRHLQWQGIKWSSKRNQQHFSLWNRIILEMTVPLSLSLCVYNLQVCFDLACWCCSFCSVLCVCMRRCNISIKKDDLCSSFFNAAPVSLKGKKNPNLDYFSNTISNCMCGILIMLF